MKKIIDEKGVCWITTEGDDIQKTLDDAITCNRWYCQNKYYAIILNGRPCFAWINSKGFLHFIVDREHYSFNKKNELKHIDTFFQWDYKKIVEQVIEDNAFLMDKGVFEKLELV